MATVQILAIVLCIGATSFLSRGFQPPEYHIYNRLGSLRAYLQTMQHSVNDITKFALEEVTGIEGHCGFIHTLAMNITAFHSSSNLSVTWEDCSDILAKGPHKNGVYTVWPPFFRTPVYVYCDMTTDKGGWTVIQRRGDYGKERRNFFRGWNDYTYGFGNLSEDFWLGNDLIFALTSAKPMELRVELEDFQGNKTYAEYESFHVAGPHDHYKLTVNNYRGTAGDALQVHSGIPFTTKDRDNDHWAEGNCAETYKGGWWYRQCLEANLNGLYLIGSHESYADGVIWNNWLGFHYSLNRTEMKIRPLKTPWNY